MYYDNNTGGGKMTGESEKPLLPVRKRGLKLSKATSLLTSASKRDGVRSSAGGSDTLTKKKKTLRDVKPT